MTRTTRQQRLRPLIALAGSLALATSALAAAPTATAHDGPDTPTTVATGLNSPRLLSFDEDGNLFVAEAGTGGSCPCVTGGEGTICLGMTGSITRVRNGHQKRVLTDLPSLAGADGSAALGPADVSLYDDVMSISMGAGISRTQRDSLGKDAGWLGTILRVQSGRHHGDRSWSRRCRHDRTSSQCARVRVYADIVAWEFDHNPDHSTEHDSDPVGFLEKEHGYVLADAGGNDLLRVTRDQINPLAVFPDVMVTLPPEFGGGMGPMQAVPTAVAKGPDGALYVSQLTGFPFPKGGASIWRVVEGQAPTVYATGLTNVTDLAWYHGKLYAVQIADDGLLSAEGDTLPLGSLLRIHAGDNSTPDSVVSGLMAPYGVAFKRHNAYVTTCSVCPAGGTVLKVPMS